jgi:hypothetical protein
MNAQVSALEWAIAYASLGWRIFPVVRRGKRPLLPGWQDDAPTDPGLIDFRFASGHRSEHHNHLRDGFRRLRSRGAELSPALLVAPIMCIDGDEEERMDGVGVP